MQCSEKPQKTKRYISDYRPQAGQVWLFLEGLPEERIVSPRRTMLWFVKLHLNKSQDIWKNDQREAI